MVNSTRVAEIERIDDLDDDTLDLLVLSEERELLDDGVKVAGAEVVDEVGIGARVDLTMECEYVGVRGNLRMQAAFASLAIVRVVLLYTLDGIVCSSSCVDRAIHNAKSPSTQDRLNPERTAVDSPAQKLGCRVRIRRHWGRVDEGLQPRTEKNRHLVAWVGGG